MALSIKEGNYYAIVWFAESRKNGNILATLYKEGAEKDQNIPWKLSVRLRIYKDGRVFDSDDEKKWYAGEFEGNDDGRRQAWEKVQRAIHTIDKLFPLEVHTIAVEGDAEKFLATLRDQPWAHLKEVKKGDPEWDEYDLDSKDDENG